MRERTEQSKSPEGIFTGYRFYFSYKFDRNYWFMFCGFGFATRVAATTPGCETGKSIPNASPEILIKYLAFRGTALPRVRSEISHRTRHTNPSSPVKEFRGDLFIANW